MTLIRRIAVFVLLFALPFQAAIGAMGLHCLKSTHQVQVIGGAPAEHGHSGGVPAADAADAASHDVVHDAKGATVLHLLGGGECPACSSCCFSAAAVPAVPSLALELPASAGFTDIADAAVRPDARDGPFRPPRTILL